MSSPPQPADPLEGGVEPPPPSGRPVLAWLVISATVAFVVFRTATATAARERLDPFFFRMQARILVGLGQVLESTGDIYQQARALDRGGMAQRLRFVVLAAELAGAREGLDRLAEARELVKQGKLQFSPPQERVADILHSSLAAREEHGKLPDLGEAARELLLEELGWVGRLMIPGEREHALDQARRTAVIVLAVIGGFLAAAGLGLLVLVLLLVLRFAGRLPGSVPTGGPTGVYVETFAFWMALYVAVGYLTRYLPAGDFRMGLSGLIMLLSLALALCWPLLRGLPWQQVRREVGLFAGERPLREVLLGLVCYLSALPLLVAGVFLTQGLMGLKHRFSGPPDPFGPGDTPGHPLVEHVLDGGWPILVQVIFTAGIVAPLLEETLFRGFLYRHLRGPLGFAGATLLVSFLFAVIHPQGLLGIPPIMGLAIAFTLFREWRGSLLSAMVAHGINNTAVTVLLITAMR